MNFLITMAGRGERFLRAGYMKPKMLIAVHGRTLLEWSLGSLPLHLCTRLVFVGLAQHEHAYSLSARLPHLVPRGIDVRWRWLPEVTRGQAESALAASADLLMDQPLIIFNIDTRFSSSTLAKRLCDPALDGVLGAFRSDEPRFSYAQIDARGRVIDVREKQVISPFALTGLYSFRDARDFIDTARCSIAQRRAVNGEYYIAPLYNDLIAVGKCFALDYATSVDVLGTPEEVEAFRARSLRRI